MLRWRIKDEGTIEWQVSEADIHTDDIEMAGFLAVDTVTYGVDEAGFVLKHHPIFPTLRTRPNNTRASYQREVKQNEIPSLLINGNGQKETLVRVRLDGTLKTFTRTADAEIERVMYPSTGKRIVWERITVKNVSDDELSLSVLLPPVRIDKTRGPFGDNVIEYMTTFEPCRLLPNESYTYAIGIYGKLINAPTPQEDFEISYAERIASVERLTGPLVLETGNDTLDTALRFAKIRAGESVFDTKCGRIHSPGGFNYYAATWCNDEVEYSGPYFAYTGDPFLADAAMNAYRMYMPFMSDDYEPIPSSVIAEGLDYWDGKGDRGDAAMYLFGASRFALANADRNTAAELLPAIEWCAEYCKRKTNAKGIIISDTDELENRFPSGDANLCTSSLAYAGLIAASYLEREFGKNDLADEYERRSLKLKEAINVYFSASIHGFDTYRYFDGCEKLRSWGAIPLTVGIFDRAQGTVDSLLSDYMKRPDGFLSEEGCETIWDRSTLYAIRGIFAAGHCDEAAEFLLKYCENRLLGERVPYPIETYPENNRRHLSGESALFVKVITEGLIGLNPTGFNTFTLCPYLPKQLDLLYLKNVRAHGATFDVLVEKGGFRVVNLSGKVLASGKLGELTKVDVS